MGKMDELDGFRYRARDAWRSVTKIAIREARLKEIKMEILNSQKLKSYFEDNPRDKQLLRHDKALHTVKQQQHLKNVPEYIVPETLKKMTGMSKRKGRNKKGKVGGRRSLRPRRSSTRGKQIHWTWEFPRSGASLAHFFIVTFIQ